MGSRVSMNQPLNSIATRWAVISRAAQHVRLSFFFFCPVACSILVLQPGIESRSLAGRVLSLNHWPAKEFLV